MNLLQFASRLIRYCCVFMKLLPGSGCCLVTYFAVTAQQRVCMSQYKAYIFICFLFNDAVRRSYCVALNDRMISEYSIENYKRESRRSLFQTPS
jgi:hypothetical protein